jgi:hypothetical protein
VRAEPFSKKMTALCGAAKFREETSKKAGRQSRLAALQHGVRFRHVNPLGPFADGGVTIALASRRWASESNVHTATCQNPLLHRTPDKATIIDSNDGMTNRAARAPETSLYEPVKAFLERLGFAVKGEVCGCDIVGVRPGEPPVVVITELKMTLTLELVLQGVERLRAADEVWLAVLATRRGRDRDRRAHRLCRLLGFGLLAVHPAKGSVEILAEPAPYRPRPNLPQRRRLLKEHATRRGDTTRGGSSRQPIMTAYRQQAIACATSLEAGPMRPRDLKAVAPNAGPILRRNVYGCFERVQPGLYQLSEAGATALRHWGRCENAGQDVAGLAKDGNGFVAPGSANTDPAPVGAAPRAAAEAGTL